MGEYDLEAVFDDDSETIRLSGSIQIQNEQLR